MRAKFVNEKYDYEEDRRDVKGKVERSKKLSKEMKELILPLIQSGVSSYIEGRVIDLKGSMGKNVKGNGIGADKNGFYVYTHRARSKSYESIDKIPQKDIDFIESTG
jgi:hypothetical protein